MFCMLILVVATQKSRSEFDEGPLGRSIRQISFDKQVLYAVEAENSRGLPAVYNQVIDECYRGHEVVFLHDDIWLDDVFFNWRIRSGLEQFDVIGLVGNRVLRPDSPTWFSKDDTTQKPDSENLSGFIRQGALPFGAPYFFGPTPERVQLLDGVLIAARISSLLDTGVRFDERFDFHFYDLDFSRQANAAGLSVGTWPIAVTHASGGAYGSESWRRGLELYRNKWRNNGHESAE